MTTDHIQRVAIIRRRPTWRALANQVAVGLAIISLTGWWLMLIIGTVTDWDLSYWHTVLSLIGLRLVQVGSAHRQWTIPAEKSKKL